ncbi:MAG: hypothetical protein UV82_C0014G0022 [Candidatus Magasanikbacteria bacterium GW2011_GWD2_43_18]|nr:MAG: hypothetical protein UV18_C0008G0018 [Candidatus Magasanikbacteria bacterium GW2011_GWC2_42_27]KKT03881.1 MAG: hypothetical protein UV82_C0014G0022 [Candidatus Magasanikbacteria bacterium GW2011_GWD2_43_18]KKT25739.1 MAG: hypothetical protein UW10_C0004G0014 [Candidatus Magasanikbacteria bacterium GW2011_GWA2_43_9]
MVIFFISFILLSIKTYLIFGMFSSAGAVGIEPTQLVLETNVLPLYDAPMYVYAFFCLPHLLLKTTVFIPPFAKGRDKPLYNVLYIYIIYTLIFLIVLCMLNQNLLIFVRVLVPDVLLDRLRNIPISLDDEILLKKLSHRYVR